ncbi:MAG TPA: RsmE family RNA methyltransferase [Isosphaeraceae bacterium]
MQTAVAERFYCPQGWRNGRATLVDDEARHLARVARIGVGGTVGLFDGLGLEGDGEVMLVDRDRVELVVTHSRGGARDIAGTLVLAAAVPKGYRFDWLVEKATEIGVTRLVPIVAGRSVVDPRPAKLDRLRRRVVEACKQSGRARLMDIDEPLRWQSWLESDHANVSARLIADPGGGPIDARFDLAAGVAIAIGPEGGFTDQEVEAAVRAGYRPVSLGPTILRVETAAMASCAAVVAASVTRASV